LISRHHNSLINLSGGSGFTVLLDCSWMQTRPQNSATLALKTTATQASMAALDAISAIVPARKIHR